MAAETSLESGVTVQEKMARRMKMRKRVGRSWEVLPNISL